MNTLLTMPINSNKVNIETASSIEQRLPLKRVADSIYIIASFLLGIPNYDKIIRRRGIVIKLIIVVTKTTLDTSSASLSYFVAKYSVL